MRIVSCLRKEVSKLMRTLARMTFHNDKKPGSSKHGPGLAAAETSGFGSPPRLENSESARPPDFYKFLMLLEV